MMSLHAFSLVMVQNGACFTSTLIRCVLEKCVWQHPSHLSTLIQLSVFVFLRFFFSCFSFVARAGMIGFPLLSRLLYKTVRLGRGGWVGLDGIP